MLGREARVVSSNISGEITWRHDDNKNRTSARYACNLRHYSDCRLVVEVSVRITPHRFLQEALDFTPQGSEQTLGQQQVGFMQAAVDGNWSNRYKLCCGNYIERCADGVSVSVVLSKGNMGMPISIINNDGGSTDRVWNLGQAAGIGVVAAHEIGHLLDNVESYGNVRGIRGFPRDLGENSPRPQEGVDTELEGIMGGGRGATRNNFWSILHNVRSVGLNGCELRAVNGDCVEN